MRKPKVVTQAQLTQALQKYDSVMNQAENRIKQISDLTKLRREQIQAKYEAILKKLKE